VTADATAASAARQPTVLYIEDNDSNVQLVKGVMKRRAQVRLLTATRGGEGLELARAELPGLVLLDLHLPDMSGTEVLRNLRDDALTCDMHVVVITADITAGQVSRLGAGGADDYISKPFDVRRLLAVIDDVLLDGAE
jgi:CheY-like chemotaxis protein